MIFWIKNKDASNAIKRKDISLLHSLWDFGVKVPTKNPKQSPVKQPNSKRTTKIFRKLIFWTIYCGEIIIFIICSQILCILMR